MGLNISSPESKDPTAAADADLSLEELDAAVAAMAACPLCGSDGHTRAVSEQAKLLQHGELSRSEVKNKKKKRGGGEDDEDDDDDEERGRG